MPLWLAIMLGGALGALGRHTLSHMLPSPIYGLPFATLSVNIIGAFLLALLTQHLAFKGYTSLPLKAFLVVGVLGAFTTFSTFTLENMLLIEKGQYLLCTVYITLSIFGTLLAFAFGLWIFRFLLT